MTHSYPGNKVAFYSLQAFAVARQHLVCPRKSLSYQNAFTWVSSSASKAKNADIFPRRPDNVCYGDNESQENTGG